MSDLQSRYDSRSYRKTYGSTESWCASSKEVPPECLFPGILVYLTRTNQLHGKAPRKVVIRSYVWYYLGVKFVWVTYPDSDELVRMSFVRAYLI